MQAAVLKTLSEFYRCDRADDAATARAKLDESAYELVVCDLRLPDDSGWNLAAEIIDRRPHTSLLFLTGQDDLGMAQRAFEMGAHGYVVKPYRASQFLITVMNALKRRELELAQEAHERALQEQLQTVIDHAPLRIYVKDRDLRFLAINRIAAESTGRSPVELIGQTVNAFMSPEAIDLSQVGDRRVLRSGEAYIAEEEMTIRGETKTLLTSKFPMLDDEGAVYAVCGISADITASKQAAKLQEELVRTQQRAISELRSSRREMIERLARAIEIRDTETGGHVNRMARISGVLALGLGLDEQFADLISVAAPMHDVGKIGIPDEILLQPGSLSDEERREMEKHTTIGNELLTGSDSDLLRLGASIALTHHERWDGGGYPRGLAGEDIPIEGRIVAVADVFDALLSDRPYRPAMDLDRAVEILRDGRGSHFEGRIVDYLLEHLDEMLRVRG